MTLLSVVVPVLNEEKNVEKLIEELVKNIKLITNDYEILLIDDGSKDKTWEIIQKESSKNKNVVGFKLSRNFGHHYAITAGIHNSSGDWVVVMDGDLQDRPEVIPELYKKAQSGLDVVFVNRINRPETKLYLFFQKIFYFALNVFSGFEFDSRQANFSIISKKVVEAYKKFPEASRFYGSTIKWLGFKTGNLEAIHGKRYQGKPSYSIKRRLKLASDIILAFSDRPLKIAIFIGLLMATVSAAMVIWILVGVFSWGFTVLGWPSLIAAIFFSTGIILIILGILGVYLGQVFNQVKNRPLYLISESINKEFKN